MSKNSNFFQTKVNQPHPQRTREILKAHPEIGKLMTRNPYTAVIALGIVLAQVSLAAWLGITDQPWWALVLVAFGFGAFANHTLYVIIHDSTHNMVFKSRTLNKLLGIVADLPNLFPGAMGFRVYHIKHHAHQGDYDNDADLANHWEARFIGNSAIGKAFWLMFFPIFQLTRPPRMKINMWNKWIFINLAAVVIFDAAVLYFFGWKGALYMLCSFFFSIGFHPVGARWIQEHYTIDGKQETFSYYGPINLIALNVGYHNEHHDFPAVPWHNLPKVRAIAPEYYDTLEYHTSWTKLWLKFIFDKRYSLHSRVERIGEGKVSEDLKRMQNQTAKQEAVV